MATCSTRPTRAEHADRVRTLEQINNQIRQLQNEAQMLMNQARNLASLPSSVVNQLRATWRPPSADRARRGLAYDVTSMDREFARLYPSSTPPPSAATRCTATRERWKNTLNGLQTTMQMQAQVSQNLAKTKACWPTSWARASRPRRAASDAGHEPVAGLAGQAVDPDAAAPDHARPGGLAGTGAAGGGHGARPRSAAALPGQGTPYTPQSVNFYNN
jgi:P-type conjugative transfer protein TrbJ